MKDWSPLFTHFNLTNEVLTFIWTLVRVPAVSFFTCSADILNFYWSESEVGHVSSRAWRRMKAEPQRGPAYRKWRSQLLRRGGGCLEDELSGSAVHTRRSTVPEQTRHKITNTCQCRLTIIQSECVFNEIDGCRYLLMGLRNFLESEAGLSRCLLCANIKQQR